MVISIGTEKSFAIKYSLKIATKVFGTFTEHPSSVPRTHFGDFTIFGLTTAYNSSFRESNIFLGTHMYMTNSHMDTHSHELKNFYQFVWKDLIQ